MNKKFLYLFFFCFSFTTVINAAFILEEVNSLSITKEFFQDKTTVLIKKIKARITALENQRTRLKHLKRWTTSKENMYSAKVDKLTKNLERLEQKSISKLTSEEIIIKLQKELKYLNNSRINKDASGSWTKKDDALYEEKAAVFIDSIIKLRRKKN